MKMIGLNGFTFGIVLVLIGIIIIIKVVFKIDIPIFRILFGGLLIYFGITLILGRSSCKKSDSFKSQETIHNFAVNNESTILFSKGTFQYTPEQKEFNSIFSQSFIDLSKVDSSITNTIEINAIFSDLTIKLNPENRYKFNGSAVFGNFANKVHFGDVHLDTKENTTYNAALNIEANAIFGQIQIIY